MFVSGQVVSKRMDVLVSRDFRVSKGARPAAHQTSAADEHPSGPGRIAKNPLRLRGRCHTPKKSFNINKGATRRLAAL